MFWSLDQIALELVTCPRPVGVQLRVVEHPAERSGGAPSVTLTHAQLAPMFQGFPLARAVAMAEPNGPNGPKLYAAQFTTIYGRAADAKNGNAPHYSRARRLLAVGRAITDPIVRSALADVALELLELAAKERSPEAQITTVTRGRLRLLAAKTARRAKVRGE
jgi:hypothetical protein